VIESQALVVQPVRWLHVGDQKYLFDPASCRIARCSDVVRAVLEVAQGRDLDAVVALLAERFTEGEVRGVLATLQRLEFVSVGEPAPEPPPRPAAAELSELYLQVAHECNMSCAYCYASGGSYGSGHGLMSRDTAAAAVELLLAHRRQGVALGINFDGGEPLLNRDVIGFTVELARRRAAEVGVDIRFAIGTNGTLLDPETNAWLTRLGVEIGLSIDGEAAVHDAHRRLRDGSATYEMIVANLDALRTDGHLGPMQARATLTRGHADLCSSLDHLLGLGFRHISLEPVSGSCGPWLFTYDDLEPLKKQLDALADLYVERLLSQRPFVLQCFNEPLLRLHRRLPRVYRCNAGFGLLAVTPKGELYPCSRLSGMPEYVMGTVVENQWPDELAETFRNNTTAARAGCSSCWARGLCGGGCPCRGVLARGLIADRDRLQCELDRHIAALTVKIYVSVVERDPSVWVRMFPDPAPGPLAGQDPVG